MCTFIGNVHNFGSIAGNFIGDSTRITFGNDTIYVNNINACYN